MNTQYKEQSFSRRFTLWEIWEYLDKKYQEKDISDPNEDKPQHVIPAEEN